MSSCTFYDILSYINKNEQVVDLPKEVVEGKVLGVNESNHFDWILPSIANNVGSIAVQTSSDSTDYFSIVFSDEYIPEESTVSNNKITFVTYDIQGE